jgi:hypothetical protein
LWDDARGCVIAGRVYRVRCARHGGRTIRARNARTRAVASGSSFGSAARRAARCSFARFRMAAETTADFAVGGAGSAGAPSLAGAGVGFGSSTTGGVSAGVRRVALVTIAGMAGAAFRFRGGLLTAVCRCGDDAGHAAN